jgi:hypothetical protein
MSFFEWMLLWSSRKNESKTLRIIGSNSLKHPGGDIDFFEVKKNEVLLVLNEMSLCGADSPLPDKLLRCIRTENENSRVLAGFLNMFQHYLAMLRFNAVLEKSAFLMNKKWQGRFDLYNERFSPESLRCFFARMFSGCKVEVHCFEPCRVKNPSPLFLGRANLNETMLLGEVCTSLTSAMRVDICGISLEKSIELKRKRDFLNVKFPFRIRVNFTAKICGELSGKKLSEDFWLGNRNFEDFKWEKWL